MNDTKSEQISWATATWSVPAAVVAWLLVALVFGLAVPGSGETTYFLVATALAIVMAAGGFALSRRGRPRVRGVGHGMLCAGLACTLAAIVVVVQ